LQDKANMAGIDIPALAAAGADAAMRLPARNRPISKTIRIACEAITSGEVKTITDAAAKAGVTREYLSRELSKPHIAEFLRQKAARVVAIAAGRASARVTELVDAASEHVSFDASKHVLGIAGIKPVADPNVNLNFEFKPVGWVIDLSPDDGDRRIVDVTPAKPAGEHHDEH
jgi:hypothetical protein